MSRSFWVLLLAAMACGSIENGAVAAPLQPTAQWHVDFADEQCVASRNYGSTESPLFLVFKMPPIGDIMQIAVVRNGSVREADQIGGEIVFDDRPPIATNFLEYDVRKLKQRALLMNLVRLDLRPMRQASTIHIRSRADKPPVGGLHRTSVHASIDLTFAISDIATVLQLLDECAADLQKVWNVWDENRDSVTLKKGPEGNIQGLFRPSDYPPAALRKSLSGTATLVLLIDEFGKVADCTITRTSGAAAIDAQSCAILSERAKFQPAIGLNGKPTKSAVSQSITWRLEG